MLGTGSIVISHKNGWSCAKECEMSFEYDPKPDKTATRLAVVAINGLFDCVGIPDSNVECVMKYDAGNKIAFNGKLQGRKRLVVTGEFNNNIDKILKEIKKWQENYKVS